jgi:hypothetical protein
MKMLDWLSVCVIAFCFFIGTLVYQCQKVSQIVLISQNIETDFVGSCGSDFSLAGICSRDAKTCRHDAQPPNCVGKEHPATSVTAWQSKGTGNEGEKYSNVDYDCPVLNVYRCSPKTVNINGIQRSYCAPNQQPISETKKEKNLGNSC